MGCTLVVRERLVTVGNTPKERVVVAAAVVVGLQVHVRLVHRPAVSQGEG